MSACAPAPVLVAGPRIIRDSTYVALIELDVHELRRQLDSLQARDPTADAYNAVTRGDRRFWALEGGAEREAPRVPGLPSRELQRHAIAEYGVQVFPYTGGASVASPGSDSTWYRWQLATLAYASEYNLARLGLVPFE
jgi:hypothetical protein